MTDPAKLAVWLEHMLFEDEADQDKAEAAADALRSLDTERTTLQTINASLETRNLFLTERVAELERERDEALPWKNASLAALRDRTETAEASVKELVEGLEFYADTSNYPAPLTGGMGALWHDCGSVARALIAKHKDTSHG